MKWADQSEDNKRAREVKIARNLREFGYPDVQADIVLEGHRLWILTIR